MLEDDVLVSTVRPNLNAVALVNSSHCGSIASSGYCVLRPIKDKLDSRYLYYFTRTKPFIGYLVNLATGASYPAVSDKIVKSNKIPLPPLETQKRIVSLLDKAQELIDKRKEQIALMDQLIQSLFYDMFGDPVTNSKGWEKQNLGDITKLITDGKHGDCRNDEQSGYYFISAKDIHDGIIDYSKARQILREDFEEVHKRTNLMPSDVVIVNTGATIGKLAIAMESEHTRKTTFQKSVAVIKPIPDRLNPHYLKQVLSIGLNYFVKRPSGSAQQNLLLSQMRRINLPVPPIENQKRFEHDLQKIQTQKEAMIHCLKELDGNFNSLMQRAFKGEL